MKRKLFTIITIIFFAKESTAQEMFDMPTSAVLIAHNKQNFGDHQDLRNNQLASSATAAVLKTNTNRMKNLVDQLDHKMNSIFIIIADVTTALKIYRSISKVFNNQMEALRLVVKFPWLLAWVTSYEQKIVTAAVDLFWFIDVMVYTYGDFNKISVADRKQLYNELSHQLNKMVINSQAMVYELQLVDISQRFKNSASFQLINNDKKLVKDILSNFHF
jgi:hypothetical protein